MIHRYNDIPLWGERPGQGENAPALRFCPAIIGKPARNLATRGTRPNRALMPKPVCDKRLLLGRYYCCTVPGARWDELFVTALWALYVHGWGARWVHTLALSLFCFCFVVRGFDGGKDSQGRVRYVPCTNIRQVSTMMMKMCGIGTLLESLVGCFCRVAV